MTAVSIVKLAEQLGVTTERLREYGRRQENPLPIRLLPEAERGMFVNDAEWLEWSTTYCPLLAEQPSRR